MIISIEGAKFRAKIVPKKILLSMWRELGEKPFPKVAAFQLEDSDFDRMIELRKCREDAKREMQEWGRVLSAEGTDACVFNCDEKPDLDFIILIRKNPYHDFEEVLKHELNHIARGDL